MWAPSAGTVLDHLACAECGARLFFRNTFKHYEQDGRMCFHFVQAT